MHPRERFLKRQEIAAMLGTTPALAASFLAQRGVHPIDFGVGRSRGLRWLESAVAHAMRDMATEAAARHRPRDKKTPKPKAGTPNITSMSIDELHAFLRGRPAPNPHSQLTASPHVQ